MELADEIRVKADKATVHAMPNDPDVLKICIPGCEAPDAFSLSGQIFETFAAHVAAHVDA